MQLVASTGVEVRWTGQNTLYIHAKTVQSANLDPKLCRSIRASILLAGPLSRGVATSSCRHRARKLRMLSTRDKASARC